MTGSENYFRIFANHSPLHVYVHVYRLYIIIIEIKRLALVGGDNRSANSRNPPPSSSSAFLQNDDGWGDDVLGRRWRHDHRFNTIKPRVPSPRASHSA